MTSSTPLTRWLFSGLAVVFVASAIFHVAALTSGSLDPTAPPWRHGLFVAINLAGAAGLAHTARSSTPNRFFVACFAVLCAQQLLSHGRELVSAWTVEHRVDLNSLGVLIVMPMTLALLLRLLLAARQARAESDRRRMPD